MSADSDIDPNYMSIGTLASRTGISVDKLRIWERRYGSPKPVRLPSGHRRYPVSEAIRLRKAALAIEQGFPARIVAPASVGKLNELLGLNTRDDKKIPEWDLEDISTFRNEKISEWVKAVEEYDEGFLLSEFEAIWRELGAQTFILDMAVPLLWKIGELWADGKLTISHEHYISEMLCDYMASKWRLENKNKHATRFLLASLPGDQHRLGLQMVANIIAMSGGKVIYLGPQTPSREILRAIEQFSPEVLCISISSIVDERQVIQTLEELRLYVPDHVKMIIGGKGAPPPPTGVTRIYDLREFMTWISESSLVDAPVAEV